jgi:hypothetical protein
MVFDQVSKSVQISGPRHALMLGKLRVLFV